MFSVDETTAYTALSLLACCSWLVSPKQAEKGRREVWKENRRGVPKGLGGAVLSTPRYPVPPCALRLPLPWPSIVQSDLQALSL